MNPTPSSPVTYHEAAGAGAPLVLIHGVGLDLSMWDATAGVLSARYRVVRYDMLGHGRSLRPPGPYSLAMFAGQLRDLADALSLARLHIVGFSMGGMVAQAFAIAHPERVASLVVVSAVAARSYEQRRAVLGRAKLVEEGGMPAAIEAALQRWFTPDFARAHPQVVDHLRHVLESNDPAAYLAAYRVFATADEPLTAVLNRISCPALIITGEHDPGSTPAMAAFMGARIAGARTLIVPGVRHMLPIEAASIFTSAVLEFVAAQPLHQEGE